MLLGRIEIDVGALEQQRRVADRRSADLRYRQVEHVGAVGRNIVVADAAVVVVERQQYAAGRDRVPAERDFVLDQINAMYFAAEIQRRAVDELVDAAAGRPGADVVSAE